MNIKPINRFGVKKYYRLPIKKITQNKTSWAKKLTNSMRTELK